MLNSTLIVDLIYEYYIFLNLYLLTSFSLFKKVCKNDWMAIAERRKKKKNQHLRIRFRYFPCSSPYSGWYVMLVDCFIGCLRALADPYHKIRYNKRVFCSLIDIELMIIQELWWILYKTPGLREKYSSKLGKHARCVGTICASASHTFE